MTDPTNSASSGGAHRMRHAVWGREIPFRNPHFIGREKELADLRAHLLADSTALIGQPVQAVYGLGGVGKTELAAEYAHRYREHYDLLVDSRRARGGHHRCPSGARQPARA